MTARPQKFDWQRIHAELNERLASAGASFERDAARAQTILRQRAVQLAAIPAQRKRAPVSADFLVFRAAGARYALALASLREVVPMPPIAGVPGAAPAVRGVIPWRGEFVTVFDLAPALGLAMRDETAASHAVILRKDTPRVALAIEGAERMARLDTTTLQAPDAWPAKRADLLRGVTADAVAILDERRLTARLAEELRAA
jgi:purine-binding chemotaxis protein CheW